MLVDSALWLQYSTVDFKYTEDGAGQKMVFNIASTLAGMPFVWNFHAKPADSSMVCAMCCKPTSINLAVSYVCSVVWPNWYLYLESSRCYC